MHFHDFMFISCCLIFVSAHVLFFFTTSCFNLVESEPPPPILLPEGKGEAKARQNVHFPVAVGKCFDYISLTFHC